MGNAVFVVSCVFVFMCAIYLTMAKCYRTGLLGTFGLGFVVLGAGLFAWDALYEHSLDWVDPRTACVLLGLALFFAQFIFRVIRHARNNKAQERVLKEFLGDKQGKSLS